LKCPKSIRPCPELWPDCSLCRYVSLTNTCLYEPKSDLDIVIIAAKIAEQVVTKEAIESVEKIRGTWMKEFDQLPEGGIWEWMAKYRRPGDINYKEPLNGGPSEPGGGSKSKVPPKPPYKMPEYLKLFGQ
jgi:hypothetical protein